MFQVPGVATVEADVGDRRRQRHERLRHVGRLDLRGVDDDPRHAPLLEPAQQLVADVLRVPGTVTRLEQEVVVADLLACPLEVVERRRLPDDVRRHLEEEAAELPRVAERCERVEELAEDLGARLARGPVDAPTLHRPAAPPGGRAEPGRASPDAASSVRTPSRASRNRRACARPSPAPSAASARGRTSSRPRRSRSAPHTPGVPSASAPGGYQCFESASSAHEHVPILIGAATS